jgi:hypothetical protein
MPSLKRIDPHPRYQALQDRVTSLKDDNACAPICTAAVTGITIDDALARYAAYGRKTGRGASWAITEQVLADLGYELQEMVPLDFLRKHYPKPHCDVLKSMTTHHPRRFPDAFKGGPYVLRTQSHVTAVVDGKTLDWAVNRRLKVWELYLVVKI